jgi:hypothetical protein
MKAHWKERAALECLLWREENNAAKYGPCLHHFLMKQN